MEKFRCKSFVLLLFLAIGCAAYAGSFRNGFVLDDVLLLSPAVKNPGLIARHFIPDPGSFCYRPMVQAALTVDYALFGPNPWGYHAANCVLLALGAFLFYVLLFSLFKDFSLAFLAALFFLAHPLNSIEVNHISTVNMLLQTIWMLGALCFLTTPYGRWIIAPALFVLAVLCHESAMVLPLAAAAMLYSARPQTLKQIFLCTWPLWAVLALYFLFRMRYASLNAGLFDHFGQFQMGVPQYLASLTELMLWYGKKLIFPSGIVFTWGLPVVRTYVWAWCLLLGVFTGGVLYLFFYSVGKYKTFPTAENSFPTQQRRYSNRREEFS